MLARIWAFGVKSPVLLIMMGIVIGKVVFWVRFRRRSAANIIQNRRHKHGSTVLTDLVISHVFTPIR